jgi:hypothetical protein
MKHLATGLNVTLEIKIFFDDPRKIGLTPGEPAG